MSSSPIFVAIFISPWLWSAHRSSAARDSFKRVHDWCKAGWRRPGAPPPPTTKILATPVFRTNCTCTSQYGCTSLVSPCLSYTNMAYSSSLGTMSFAFSRSMNIQCKSCYLCNFVVAVLAQNRISCGFSFLEFELFFTYVHDVSQSIVLHYLV